MGGFRIRNLRREEKEKIIPANGRSVVELAVFDRELSAFRHGLLVSCSPIWPLRCRFWVGRVMDRSAMNGGRSASERRRWARLPLAIPVFVRSRDDKGKEFLEFATSLNVSAGGMLVAIRRVLPAVAQIRLEIPSAPVAAMAPLPRAARTLNARTLRTTPADGYYLLGLKFSRPLPLSEKPRSRRRKLVSNV